MISIESPAKLNLSLLVQPPRDDGFHPIDSLVQTIEWCDRLVFEMASEGRDEVRFDGSELDPEDNLVTRALAALRVDTAVPPLRVLVEKWIPMEAGLGGGSSNAAATLLGAVTMARAEPDLLQTVAPGIGSDVPLFLTGGSVMVSGIGEVIEPVEPLGGFAFAVVVPDFGLATAAVYRRWDEMEGPQGESINQRKVPPGLRDGIPLRNDLLPAAMDLEPRLGDFMADLRVAWSGPVCLTGSGTACFGYFPTVEEAESAARAVTAISRYSRGVALRDRGVSPVSVGER